MLLGNPDYELQTPQDAATRHQFRVTSVGESMGAAFDEALDWSSLGLIANNLRQDPDLARAGFGVIDTMFAGGDLVDEITERPRPDKTVSKPEWQQSEHYRPGIIYSKDMTPHKAQALAEMFDEREYRKLLMQRSPGGFWRGAANLTAGLAATALDPVNFIPVFGPAARAGAMARMGPVLGRAVMSGAEAIVTTAAVSPLVAMQQQEAGDQEAWDTVVWDLSLSGAVGGLFGAGAGLWARGKARHSQALAKAVSDLSSGGDVDVAPVFRQVERDFARSGGFVEGDTWGDLFYQVAPSEPYASFRAKSFGYDVVTAPREFGGRSSRSGGDIIQGNIEDDELLRLAGRRTNRSGGEVDDLAVSLDRKPRSGGPGEILAGESNFVPREVLDAFEAGRATSEMEAAWPDLAWATRQRKALDWRKPAPEVLETPTQVEVRERVTRTKPLSLSEEWDATIKEHGLADGADTIHEAQVALLAEQGALRKLDSVEGPVFDEATEWQQAGQRVKEAENLAAAWEIAAHCLR